MNLPIEQFIPSGAGLLATLAGLAGVWFKVQNKVDNLERKDLEQGRQIEALWKWKDDNEKDASKAREEFSKELFKLEGAHMVTTEQFKQIMQILNEIKDRLSILERNNNVH